MDVRQIRQRKDHGEESLRRLAHQALRPVGLAKPIAKIWRLIASAIQADDADQLRWPGPGRQPQGQSASAAIPLFAFGAFMCLVRDRYGLLVCMGAHASFNLWNLVWLKLAPNASNL